MTEEAEQKSLIDDPHLGTEDDLSSVGDNDDDDKSSMVGTSSGTNNANESSTSGRDKNIREVRDLTRKETKDVETWRELVTGILVITACFVSISAFIYLSKNETDTFHLVFDEYIYTIQHTAANSPLDAFTTVTDTITAHALSSESTWPFVTVPFFESHGLHAREIANIDVFSFCPLVMESSLTEWESYSVENQWWTKGGQIEAYTEAQAEAIVRDANDSIPERVYQLQNDGQPTTGLGRPPYAPRWQTSPPPSDLLYVNYDVLARGRSLFEAMVTINSPVTSEVIFPVNYAAPETMGIDAAVPSSFMMYPVYRNFNYSSTDIVGFLEFIFNWETFFSGLLPEEESGVFYVLNNTCGEELYTFEKTQGETIFRGEGDLHDIIYDRYAVTVELITYNAITIISDQYALPCSYAVNVYPSSELRAQFATDIPAVFTGVVALSFFLMAFFFFAYDKFVQFRNDKVIRQAAKTNAIVSSLFPSQIRDRLFGGNDASTATSGKKRSSIRSGSGRYRLKSFMADYSGNFKDGNESAKDGDSVVSEMDDQPIADLFPNCTVVFADIVGFTAWSSMREPTQVFRLLETIYHAFDQIAKRRKVFKVETIGDCYVAVTGLPEPNKQHALTMARFSRDCMFKMRKVTRSLEVTLGPDTGDLSMRFGLHSGPVTAGVLRGERSRFQLFGDTVNTAARIESTGARGCVHLSQTTADEICAAGKSNWIREREDKVQAKGKGEMTTFWLSLTENASSSAGSLSGTGSIDTPTKASSHGVTGHESYKMAEDEKSSTANQQRPLSAKDQRLVAWNVDILQRLLKQIAAKRKVTEKVVSFGRDSARSTATGAGAEHAKPDMVLEEVAEVIQLPKFNSKVAGAVEEAVQKAGQVELPSAVTVQLKEFVTTIAGQYHENPFHNFEHASHVTMSVVKLLSRIVAPADLDFDDDNVTDEKKYMKSMASKLHDNTYGITSDPLTQFAVVLSALIHDVDHPGVPNTQLVKEETETAIRYQGKSIAEQNSVDLAWNLLMEERFKELRNAICGSASDWTRFRQLVVNSVMATDIADKQQKEFRNARWDKAFKGDFVEDDPVTDRNRKATIVIEHLIQASDISHTMQHWHIYRKWNERLFRELYQAYKEGRAEKDPSEFWFNGEIGFYSFYIIPLAKKLRECGVFGVSSDEYLNYAEQNLAEWKAKGEQVTAELLEKAKAQYGE